MCRLLKKPIGEAREKLTSGDVLEQYVGARQLSAPFDDAQGDRFSMWLFQQPANGPYGKSEPAGEARPFRIPGFRFAEGKNAFEAGGGF